MIEKKRPQESSTPNPGGKSDPGNTKAHAKRSRWPGRRRWPWVIGGIAILLVLILLALPSLLCTGPGVRLIESQINSRIAGHVQIERLSLGWFSSTSIGGLTLRGPSGDMVISGLNVDTQLSLLHLIMNRQTLGKIDVAIDQVQLQSQGNGNLNLLDAIASKSAVPNATSVATPAGNAQPARSATAGSLPPLDVEVDCSIRSFSMTSPDAPTLTAENTLLSAKVNTAGAPVITHFSAALGVGSAPPAPTVLDANLEVFDNHQLLPVNQIAGSISGKIDGLDLTALEPVLTAEGIGLNIAGKLTLNLTTTLANNPESGQIKGSANISGLSLSGALIKADIAPIGDVSIPIDANWGPESFSINQLAVNSELMKFSVTGSGSPAAVEAAIQRKSGVNSTAQINIQASAELAKLIDTFPNLLSPLFTSAHLAAGTRFSEGATDISAAITLGAAGTQTQATGAILPEANGKLSISGQPIQWTQPGENTPHQASLDCQLAFDTTGAKPVQVELHLSTSEGDAAPAQLTITGNVAAIANQNVLPLDQWSGPAELQVEDFVLPDMAQFNLPIVPRGILNGDVKLDAQAAHKGNILGQLNIDQLALSGAMLKGDQPELGTLNFPVNVQWNQDNLTITQLGFRNPAASVILSGTTSLAALESITPAKNDWGNSDLKLACTYDLAALSHDLPHVLGLAGSGLTVNSGAASVNLELANTGTQSSCKTTANLTNLAGLWGQKPFTIDPIQAQADLERLEQKWNIINAQLTQGNTPAELLIQISPTGDASAQAYTLESQADLARLVAEIGQIVDLKGLAVAGQLDWKTQFSEVFSPSIGYSTTLNWTNASVVPGAGKTPISEPQITLNAQGKVDMMGGVFNGITSTFDFNSSIIQLVQSQLQLKLDAKKSIEVPTMQLAIASLSLDRLTQILTPMVASLGPYNISGQMSNSVIDAAYTPGEVNISKVHLAVSGWKITSTQAQGTVEFTEPALTIDLGGTFESGATSDVNVSDLNIADSDGLFDAVAPQPVIISKTAQGLVVSCPSIKIDSDLAKLQLLLKVLGVLQPADKLQGQLTLTGSATQQGSSITLDIDSTVNNYQLLQPQAKFNIPPTNLFTSLDGQLDLAADTFTIQKDSQVGERAVDLSGSNQATIYQGTTLGWAPGAQENVHATISYDLARLQLLLGPFLPSGLTMTGRHSVDIHVVGALTQDQGIRKIRNLSIDRTGPAFDQIVYDGMTLGPGTLAVQEQNGILTLLPTSIPANSGSLNLSGTIDLNQAEPALVIAEPLQVLQNVQLDTQLGDSLLGFLPLAWGGGQSAITVKGVANLQIQQAYLPLDFDELKKDGTTNGTVSITNMSTNSPIFAAISGLTNPLGGFSGNNNVQLANSGISPTNFQLKHGKVHYQNMQVTLSTFGMELTGWVALDTTMHMDVSVMGGGITVPIPLAIDGTTSKPKVKLSGKPLKNIGNTLQQVPNLLNGILGH
jgi:hypothetical protein